eukprot:m.1659770 g.1659770  ORF g.1659770 m.1659770 type:complete len:61 (-) comp119826_c0_seq1:14-196(-)
MVEGATSVRDNVESNGSSLHLDKSGCDEFADVVNYLVRDSAFLLTFKECEQHWIDVLTDC